MVWKLLIQFNMDIFDKWFQFNVIQNQKIFPNKSLWNVTDVEKLSQPSEIIIDLKTLSLMTDSDKDFFREEGVRLIIYMMDQKMRQIKDLNLNPNPNIGTKINCHE